MGPITQPQVVAAIAKSRSARCSLRHMLFQRAYAGVLQLGCTLPALMTYVVLLQLESLPNCLGLLQVNPQSSVLRCYAGMALHKMGRTQEALQQLQVEMLSRGWLSLLASALLPASTAQCALRPAAALLLRWGAKGGGGNFCTPARSTAAQCQLSCTAWPLQQLLVGRADA